MHLIGLCPDCSEKLNYHSKKREIKRLKHTKHNKSKHNKGSTNPTESSPATSGTSTSSRIHDDGESSADTSVDTTMKPAGNDAAHHQLEQIFWTKTTHEVEKTREEEFDEYLANLLL